MSFKIIFKNLKSVHFIYVSLKLNLKIYIFVYVHVWGYKCIWGTVYVWRSEINSSSIKK